MVSFLVSLSFRAGGDNFADVGDVAVEVLADSEKRVSGDVFSPGQTRNGGSGHTRFPT